MIPPRLTIEQLREIRAIQPTTALACILAEQLIASIQREADLTHDIERHVAISAELATENAQLRHAMLEAHRLIAEGEIFEATAILKINGVNQQPQHQEDPMNTDNHRQPL